MPLSINKKIRDQFAGVGKMVPWTLHDLRRTYATNLQRLGIRPEVTQALPHQVSGTREGTIGTYQRHRYKAEMREAVKLYENRLRRAIMEG